LDQLRLLLAAVEAKASLLVHHSTKNGEEFFGSVSFMATVEAMIKSVVKDPTSATVSCVRMREGAFFNPFDITFTKTKVKTLPNRQGIDEFEILVVASSSPASATANTKGKKQDQLGDMEFVLELHLGNKATRTEWMTKMQNYGRGWSEPSFDKKLKLLKEQGRVAGGGGQNEYYSVAYTDQAKRARGSTTLSAQGGEPSEQNQPPPNYPHLIPLKGDEGSEGSFGVQKVPSNHPHEGYEGSSRQSCNEAMPVVSEPAKGEIEGDDVAAEALKHLTEKKTG
jgi:hypothetical protein